jgi:uncharacterized protein YhbP (UPF0306 family)
MKIKSAMNLQGEVLSIATTSKMITLIKGEQFNAEMADTTGVLVDDEPMTLATARRLWIYKAIDNWIDEVEDND